MVAYDIKQSEHYQTHLKAPHKRRGSCSHRVGPQSRGSKGEDTRKRKDVQEKNVKTGP